MYCLKGREVVVDTGDIIEVVQKEKMKRRFQIGIRVGLLLVLATLVVWQGSFTFGRYGPSNPSEAYIFWGLSTLIFLLTVLVGFMLFRDGIKLYVARRSNQEGSRIRTKMVVGALALTLVPTVFLVIWSVEVLNRNLDKWFSMPAERIRGHLVEIGEALEGEEKARGQSLAYWAADSEALRRFLATGKPERELFDRLCGQPNVLEAYVHRPDGGKNALCQAEAPADRAGRAGPGKEILSRAALPDGSAVVVRTRLALDVERSERMIREEVYRYDQLTVSKKEMRTFYLQLLVLITLFIVFIALWVALFLARQISVPISALLEAAREVRSGNLAHRVKSTPSMSWPRWCGRSTK